MKRTVSEISHFPILLHVLTITVRIEDYCLLVCDFMYFDIDILEPPAVSVFCPKDGGK